MVAPENSIYPLLQQRAQLKAVIRQFFAQRDVLEVDVPALAVDGVTDPYIDNIKAQVNGQQWYLQSSPEYFMKRLLAAGSGSIYSLNYAYRDGESGHRHRPEFMMLEWYRVGWDEHRLMDEISELFCAIGFENLTPVILSYAEVFEQATGVNFWQADHRCLQNLASELSGSDFSSETRSSCFDLIFSLKVEPCLPDGLVYITDYPACQCALAKLDEGSEGHLVARRFEAFYDRMEIANGYFELTDAKELRQRFEADQKVRTNLDKPDKAIDEAFLAAMGSGMPSCAGVAMGIDRILMQLLSKKNIKDVLPTG